MSIEITMPALSPTMEHGNLAKWLVKEGDEISSGDMLCEIETDKATMEFESIDDGVVAKILVAEGAEDVAVGTPIMILAEEGEDAATVEVTTSVAAPVVEALPIAAEPTTEKMVEAPAANSASNDPELTSGTPMVSLTIREALRDAMAEEMRLDGDVFVMGEEVAEYQGAYKVTQGLHDEFGDGRVIDTPITEHGFAGLGAGAAMAGLKPVIEFMTFNFAMQAIDHIVNSAAKIRYMSGGKVSCPIVFRGPNGAAARVGAQHSQNFAPWYSSVPGLIVIAPYDAADCKGLLKAAIRDPNPVVFLENELMYGETFDIPDVEDYVLPIGKARVRREGADVTIISYSIAVGSALKAADKLAEEGINAEVIDLRTIRPLDMETVIESVKKTNRVVIAEDGWPQCSVASEISARLMEEAFDYLDAPVTRVTNHDVPQPYAANLELATVVDADKVVTAVKSVCYKD